jgi:hypothetical protein
MTSVEDRLWGDTVLQVCVRDDGCSGGRIVLQSARGAGTSVEVALPLDDDPSKRAALPRWREST